MTAQTHYSTLDRVKIFYYRNEHQTIKTYSAKRYLHVIKDCPDEEPELHSEVYRRGVSFAQILPITTTLNIDRRFDSVIPILDIGNAI
jgi:hypothetical protein